MNSTIWAKGYGRIHRYIMRDAGIPLLSKTIYAYLCSFAGDKEYAYPSRERILRDLNISKNTYCKYIKCLEESGVVLRQKTSTGNLFTLHHSQEGCAKGYGSIPKSVMLNPAISAQAKGIYAYFQSLAGSDKQAYPRTSTVLRDLGISESTYYRHLQLLRDAKLIYMEQQKHEGRFSVNLTYLMDILPENEFSTNSKSVENHSTTLSQKSMDEKTVHANLGRPYNTTISKTINTSLSEKSITSNTHGGEVKNYAGWLTKKELKEQLHYDLLLENVDAGIALQDRLGNYQNYFDREEQRKEDRQIIKDTVHAIFRFFSYHVDSILLDGVLYSTFELQQALYEQISFDQVDDLVSQLCDHKREIHSMKAYTTASIQRMAREALLTPVSAC